MSFYLKSTTLYATPSTDYVPIGDIICLHINIQLPRGNTPATTLVVNVAPVGKLRTLNGTVLYMPSNIVASLADIGAVGVLSDTDFDPDGYDDTVTITLGDLMNTPGGEDNITIEVFADVLDLSTNINGEVLSNNAYLSYSSPQLTITTPLTLHIGEPVLVQTVVWSPASGDAGDNLTCTVTITHDASSKSPALYVDVYTSVAANSFAHVIMGSNTSTLPSIPLTFIADPPFEPINSALRLELGDTLVCYCTVKLLQNSL